MTALLTQLIDKTDNFEIIRDKIASILVIETANQMALADADNKNPDDWKLRVFLERNNPWEQVINEDANTETELTPIVNVSYEKCTFDPSASNVVERQKCDAIYNIDCYGFGVSKDVMDGGHSAGDLMATLAVHKCVRLVRNILMSGVYTYLGSPRGANQIVWGRFINNIQIFQPQIFYGGDRRHDIDFIKTCGGQISLRVTFSEFSPQVQPVPLEFVSVEVKRLETGEVVINADYDYT